MFERVDLLSEYEIATRAIKVINNGGKINAIVFGMQPIPPEEMTPETPPQVLETVVVQTGDMVYPEQMMDSIKTQLQERRARAVAKLAEFGVTGLGD